jgi:hypothetical protein
MASNETTTGHSPPPKPTAPGHEDAIAIMVVILTIRGAFVLVGAG